MIAWGIETLVATTLLMLLVLAIRGPVRRAVGPGLAYALWLLPVLRLMLPPLPGNWSLARLIEPVTQRAIEAPGVTFGVMNADAVPAEVVQAAVMRAHVELAGHAANVAVVPPTPVAGMPSPVLLLIGLWAIGALMFLGYHLVAHSRFCARLTRRARVEKLVAGGRVRLIETDATQGPLAFGIWRKYVAFPKDFRERYDAIERDLALAHELGHHVRGDLIANWVALLVLAIHWFNPVAWRAFRAFRADQEMACDALVLAGRAPRLRHAYGRAIVKSAHGGAVSAACHLHTINDIKGRLRMLTTTRRASRRQIAAGLSGIATLALVSLTLTASGTQAAERIKAKVETAVGMDTAGFQDALPPPPVAPAAPQAVPMAPSAAAPAAPAAPAPLAKPGEDEQVSEWTDKDGKHHVYRIVRRHGDDREMADGKHKEHKRVMVVTTDGDMKMAFKDIPEVSDGKCGTEGPRPQEMVIQTRDGGKRKMVICVDRIEASAKQAQALALQSADWGKMQGKLAMRSALMGLEMARRSIENQSSLSADQRAEALKGIDQALGELRKDGADADKD